MLLRARSKAMLFSSPEQAVILAIRVSYHGMLKNLQWHRSPKCSDTVNEAELYFYFSISSLLDVLEEIIQLHTRKDEELEAWPEVNNFHFK